MLAVAPPTAEDFTHAEWYQEAGRTVRVLRTLVPEAEPDGLRPVWLSYPELTEPVPAAVDQHAILRVSDEAPLERVLEELGLVSVRPLMPSTGMWLVASKSNEDGLKIASRLVPMVRPEGPILLAAPDLWLRHRLLQSPPNDPQLPSQWYWTRLKITTAWALSQGDPSVTVVVIDNGCDLQHPDLKNKMDPGQDVITGDGDPSYVPGELGNEHGTACSGIIGAETNNDIGIAGGCPNCRLRCVRLLGADDELIPVSADVDAFQFALDVGAQVVSNSWGFVDAIPVPLALSTAIQQVFDEGRDGLGSLILFAVGNDSHEIQSYELVAVRGVLGIGAVNNYDEKTTFTNWGDAVDLVAPGGTYTTDISGSEGDNSGDYTSGFGGTSSACPVAAGIAGLLVSAAPNMPATDLYDVLTTTATHAPYAETPSGHDSVYGWGIIDPVSALQNVLGLDPNADGGDSNDGESGCGCRSVNPSVFVLSLFLLCGRRKRLNILGHSYKPGDTSLADERTQ